MQLLAWIGLCFAVAFLLRNRPTAAIICIIALWFFVPTVGSYLLTGQRIGPLTFHAATWLTFAVICVQMVQDPRSLLNAVARNSYLFLILLLVLATSLLTTRTVQTGGGIVLLTDQMIVPAVLFLLIISVGGNSPTLVYTLRNFLFLCASIVTLIAMWQWSSQSVLLYESGFLTQFWFNPETQRWMGTFDQPLALSLVLCALMPLLAGVRRLFLAVPMLALFMAGVMITQSRVGMIVASAGAVYAIAFSRHRRSIKALVLTLVGVGFVGLLASPLAAGILERVADDTGSTEARNKAYGVFARDWEQYFFTGQGVTSSYEISEYAGLQTSFESSVLMYAVDIGIFFAILYFGLLLFVVLRNHSRHHVPGLTIAGLVVAIIPHTYSGLATRSVAGVVVWTVVAMTVIAAQRSVGNPRIRTSAGQRPRSPADEDVLPDSAAQLKPRHSIGSDTSWIGR
ncbi:hypothetical protein IWX64_002910 [Arthrobacter sp. CAN_A212]|uniref:hypothetical protein n=1 Tax=Arthrobacter sp. CAN_A212 TaxID=2787719 RepID=UPI0018CADCFC